MYNVIKYYSQKGYKIEKDKVFNKPIKKQFEFDEDVAAVFDDMLRRSVPFYKESQDITKYFAIKNLNDNETVYDLGCSTATMLLEVERACEKSITCIGLDTSDAMLSHAQKKIDIYNSRIHLINADILNYEYKNAKVFTSNYTLQFIRPLERDTLVKNIASSLSQDGVFIFSEKIISEDKQLNKELIDCYYDFKKTQGYSEYEIMQKREALENVLVPYSVNENITMMKRCGFKSCEVIFQWANFATFIAKV